VRASPVEARGEAPRRGRVVAPVAGEGVTGVAAGLAPAG